MNLPELIEAYARGGEELQRAVAGMSEAELRAAPVAGKWSTLEVLCHLADFEPIYADRMKRVLAEQEPTFFSGDPDLFAAGLTYPSRHAEEEVRVVQAVRAQMVRILRAIPEAAFQRKGIHSTDGPVTLETLLRRITNHIPHHVRFIAEKRAAFDQPE